MEHPRVRAGLVLGLAIVSLLAPAPSFARSRTIHRCDDLDATIVGTPRDDVLRGTPDADVMVGRGGNDTIRGLAGDDVICGGEGNDVLLGGDGNDPTRGNTPWDVPCPGRTSCAAPSEFLGGGPGERQPHRGVPRATPCEEATVTTSSRGGPGTDRMEPDAGIDQVHGGTGRDVANYTWSSTGITANLTTGLVTGWGDDTLSGIEDLWGSQGDDVLIGDAGINEIWGAQEGARDDGDDTIEGRGGKDYLFGLEGADTDVRRRRQRPPERGLHPQPPGAPTPSDGGLRGEDRCFYGESYSGCESS